MRLKLLVPLLIFWTYSAEAEMCLRAALKNSYHQNYIDRVKKHLGVDRVIIQDAETLKGSKGVFYPGSNTIAISEKMAREFSVEGKIFFSHEARHAYLHKLLKEGRVTPYHGEFKLLNEEGVIPNLERTGYRRYVSFEESLTHREDSRKLLRVLKKALESNNPNLNYIERLSETAIANAQAGGSIHNGTVKQLREVRESIDPNRITVSDHIYGKVIDYEFDVPAGPVRLRFFDSDIKGNKAKVLKDKIDTSIREIEKNSELQNGMIRTLGMIYTSSGSIVDKRFILNAFQSAAGVGKRDLLKDAIDSNVLKEFLSTGKRTKKRDVIISHPNYDFDLKFDESGYFIALVKKSSTI